MISSIGETSEFRRRKYAEATDVQKDKYNKEMEQWRKDFPLTYAVMYGEEVTDEIINDVLAKPL